MKQERPGGLESTRLKQVSSAQMRVDKGGKAALFRCAACLCVCANASLWCAEDKDIV